MLSVKVAVDELFLLKFFLSNASDLPVFLTLAVLSIR